MAFEAFSRAHDHVPRIDHVKFANRSRVFFGGIFGGVLAKPSLRGSVAVFAGDAFGEFKRARAQFRRRSEYVARETFRRFFGFAKFKNFGHAFADVAGERLEGPAVFVLDDPGRIFVLQDAAAGDGFDAAVATGGGARAGANVFVGGGIPSGTARLRGKQRRGSERNAQHGERDAGMIGDGHARTGAAG